MRFRNELGQRGMAQHTRRQSVEPINLGKEITSATGSKVRVPENTVVLDQTNQLRVSELTRVPLTHHLKIERMCVALSRASSPFYETRTQIAPVSSFTPIDYPLWLLNGVCNYCRTRRRR
jgi:hypothetical protein